MIVDTPSTSSSAVTKTRDQDAPAPVAGLPALLEQLDALAGAGALDLDHLKPLLEGWRCSDGDLSAFRMFSPSCYQRNRIRRTDEYEVLLLCWSPGQESAIHDHTGSACAFRVLEGQCTEVRYEGDALVSEVAHRTSEAETFPAGCVCASFDSDIHRVENRAAGNLCTLHIYAPPLDAMNTYRDRDEAAVAS